jgi:hypothetical protein
LRALPGPVGPSEVWTPTAHVGVLEREG